MANDHLSLISGSIASASASNLCGSPVRHTVRCSKHGACTSCEKGTCRFPVHCYSDPIELTLEWLCDAECKDDPEFAALLQQACFALAAGALETAEAVIETALERWNDIQNEAFLRRVRYERTHA